MKYVRESSRKIVFENIFKSICCGGVPLRNLALKRHSAIIYIRKARSLKHQVTISHRNAASPR